MSASGAFSSPTRGNVSGLVCGFPAWGRSCSRSFPLRTICLSLSSEIFQIRRETRMPSFAYLFERFPSFTQTFCYREVLEMCRQGMAPAIYSIRMPDDIPADCPAELASAVRYLPDDVTLIAEIKKARAEGRLKRQANDTIAGWGSCSDKLRAYAAAWLGPLLVKQGIRHVHCHFAGIAARTAYWLKEFYGIRYSFTGHANDIFCETDFPVTVEDLVREAAFVVTVTDFSRELLRNRCPSRAAKIHRVYNGIDLSAFPESNPSPGKPYILSVGRCIEKKGYADLIDACAILRDRGIEFECIIAGGGPLEESLRMRVAQHGLEGVVTMAGPLPQEEVRRLLAGANLFVLACAREAEGGMDNFPTVIVEAMASGVPVVSTRLAGVPEMVRDGENGLLVDERQPEALADAIEQILANPDLGRRYGLEGKSMAIAQFSADETVRQLKRLVVRRGRAGVPWAAVGHDPALVADRLLRPLNVR